MGNDRKKLGITDGTHGLNAFSFFKNGRKIFYDIAETLEYIDSRLPFPCQNHPQSCQEPNIELYEYGYKQILCLKVCEKHGYVITAPVVINSSGYVEIIGLKPCVKGVICDGSWTIENLETRQPNTPDGLNKALQSYGNLEQLLGHEKVPIPKDVNDVEGWNRFSKAMGIPDKAEGYGLPDANIPKDMAEKGLTLDKNQFAEIMHAHKVHPAAVKGIWDAYQKVNVEAYQKAMEAHSKQLIQTVNQLKSEWGDAYEANVELGQMVINKFSADKEMNDYLTTVLSRDPRAIKFLAKIGDQFAENKIGEFSMKRFSLSPSEAREESMKMSRDMDGPYMNQRGKFTDREHQAAVDRFNMLVKASMQGQE